MMLLRSVFVVVVLSQLSSTATTGGPFDTLTQFARRFWTTMASVAREDARLKRAEEVTLLPLSNTTNVTLIDAVLETSVNPEVEIVTPKPNNKTTTLEMKVERPLNRKRNRTGNATKITTVAAKRKLQTSLKPSVEKIEIRTDKPEVQIATTCNDTSLEDSPATLSSPETLSIEKEHAHELPVFSISHVPHSLKKTQKEPLKPQLVDHSDDLKAVVTVSPVTPPKLANVTSSPLVNDSASSHAVASLIKAITTAMVLVSEKLDSKLDSVVTLSNIEEEQKPPQKLDLKESPSVLPVKNKEHLGTRNNVEFLDDKDQGSAAPNFAESFFHVSQPEHELQKEDENLLNVQQVIANTEVSVKLQPSSSTRPPIKNETDEAGECFFEISDQKEMCNWNFTSSSSIHWSFGLGETAFMQGGPIRDSNGRIFGGYAFIDTLTGFSGNSIEIQRAEMESPKLEPTSPSGRCFTFWYNIGGLSADRLRILLVAEEDFENLKLSNRIPAYSVLWERKDTTNNSWTKGEVLYTFSRPHRLILEGFARSGNDHRRKFQGFIAVDDLAVDSDSCKAFCTFEGMLCGWENDNDDDNFDWQLGRGSLSHLTGPVRDHGDGPEGGYMFTDSSYPRRPGDVARFKSPKLPSTVEGPVCFKFWTHMYGNGIGTLKILQKSEQGEKVVWEVTGESGNIWHLAQVTMASSSDYQIILEGIIGRNFLGNIAVDDISFGPGPCPSSPQTALPSRGDCTFEADECGWINAGSGDQYDWIRTSPTQPILSNHGPNTGYKPPEPLSDHTTGLSSGFMLTMERSSVPPRAGDQAYIVGPILQGSQEGRCFSFYSYMHERAIDTSGPGLGSLRVYLRVGSSSILKPIWRLINYEHPDWFFSQAPITTTEKFQIVLAGTWGSTRQGAISIDDFTFYDGNCSVVPAEAKVMPGECTFDSNLCEWTSVSDTNKELSTWQLSTSNRRPANLNDHTYRATAGYVFFDIFSQHPHTVRLESPELTVDNSTDSIDSTSERCLTFWFAPYGSSNRNTFLRIIQKDLETETESPVWEVTSANFQVFRPDWIYGQVSLATNITQRIIFEGSSNNGGFAVDDIMFVPGNCESRPVVV